MKTFRLSGNNSSDKQDDYSRMTYNVIIGILSLNLLIIILILLLGRFSWGSSSGALTVLTFTIGCLMSGVILGFLFGIPRTDKKESPTEEERILYIDNTNLEEISDWLTKIIVGLSLI